MIIIDRQYNNHQILLRYEAAKLILFNPFDIRDFEIELGENLSMFKGDYSLYDTTNLDFENLSDGSYHFKAVSIDNKIIEEGYLKIKSANPTYTTLQEDKSEDDFLTYNND